MTTFAVVAGVHYIHTKIYIHTYIYIYIYMCVCVCVCVCVHMFSMHLFVGFELLLSVYLCVNICLFSSTFSHGCVSDGLEVTHMLIQVWREAI